MFGGFIAVLGELIRSEIVGGGEAGEVGHDDDLGELALFALGPFNGDGEGALEDAEERAEVSADDGLERQADGEDDVGLHIADGGGWEVVEDAAVDVFVAIHLKRLIDARERDGGANGIGQGASGKGDDLGVGEVGGDAAERDGKGVEVDAIVVAEEAAVEKGVEALVGEDGVAEGDTVTEADGEGVGEGAGVFAAAEGAAGVGGVEAEDLVEDAVVHDDFEAIDGSSGGVERADHAAHAGAGDDIDRDVVFFKPLEHADLGEGKGAAATERKADARAACGTGWRDGGRDRLEGVAARRGFAVALCGRGACGALAVICGARLGCGLGGGAVRCCRGGDLLGEERRSESKRGREEGAGCGAAEARGVAKEG